MFYLMFRAPSQINTNLWVQSGTQWHTWLFSLMWFISPRVPRALVSFNLSSVVSNSFATPWTVAWQVPLSMGFSRQEYWSGFPFPSPEVPTQELNPGLLHCRQILYWLSYEGSHELLIAVFEEFSKKGICNRYLILNVSAVDGTSSPTFTCAIGLKGKHI